MMMIMELIKYYLAGLNIQFILFTMIIRINNQWLLTICKKCSWIWRCNDCYNKTNQSVRRLKSIRLSLKDRAVKQNNQLKGTNSLNERQQKLESAIQSCLREQYDISMRQFQQIQRIIDSSPKNTPEDEDILAYACASLSNLYILTKMNNFQGKGNKALSIYQKHPQKYIEEIITIKNNLALAKSAQKNEQVSSLIYQEVLTLEDKFYSINDERRLWTLNNMMCSYFEKGKFQQAQSTYKICVQVLANSHDSKQVNQLILQNYNYYHGLIEKSQEQEIGNIIQVDA